MQYRGGLACWNGPDRSTTVRVQHMLFITHTHIQVVLSCGNELALTAASEPGRCEYQFELTAPAACPDPDTFNEHLMQHEEL